jgi:hypothetical protein
VALIVVNSRAVAVLPSASPQLSIHLSHQAAAASHTFAALKGNWNHVVI